MAEIVENDVEPGSGEVLIEKRIVSRRHSGYPILAGLVVLAFVVTCAVVFFGDRMGLRTPPPATVVVTPPGPAAAP
jgi:hypothetical protein